MTDQDQLWAGILATTERLQREARSRRRARFLADAGLVLATGPVVWFLGYGWLWGGR